MFALNVINFKINRKAQGSTLFQSLMYNYSVKKMRSDVGYLHNKVKIIFY
jgi:hypothetical protein